MPPRTRVKRKKTAKKPRGIRVRESTIQLYSRVMLLSDEVRGRILSYLICYRDCDDARAQMRFLKQCKGGYEGDLLVEYIESLKGLSQEDRERSIDHFDFQLSARRADGFIERLMREFTHGKLPRRHRDFFVRFIQSRIQIIK